jgi:hypothetical protein
MATGLEIRAQLETMRSLPRRLERLESLLGTTNWPNQPVRVHFPSGMTLTPEERAFCDHRRASLVALIECTNLTAQQCSKARLSLLTQMLLGFPTAGGNSEAAANAKIEIYSEAVRDLPPWAINNAIKRWARGEGGSVTNPNFTFAPSPADLRRICTEELEPFKAQRSKLDRLLSAVSAERANDPAPMRASAHSVGGRVIELGMRRQ